MAQAQYKQQHSSQFSLNPNQNHYSERKNDSDSEAIQIFNTIKETYSRKIEELNELKRQVFLIGHHSSGQNGEGYLLDHQQRSRLRILIESMLIDVNEEIFALSEELAKSFGSMDRGGINKIQRAFEFDQRKNKLLRKIKEMIDDNHSVKIIRRHARIAQNSSTLSLSPRNRNNQMQTNQNMNTFGARANSIDSDRLQRPGNYSETKKRGSRSPIGFQRHRSGSNRGASLRRKYSSNKFAPASQTFDDEDSTLIARRHSNNSGLQNRSARGHSSQSLKRRKSPISLRLRENAYNSGARNIQQKMIVDVFKQHNQNQQFLTQRGGGNQNTSRSLRRNSQTIPQNQQQSSQKKLTSGKNTQSFQNLTYDGRNMAEQLNDKTNQQRKVGKRLEDFEKYLAKKQGTYQPQFRKNSQQKQPNHHHGSSFAISHKENVKPVINYQPSSQLPSNMNSEAFEAFACDFALLRKTVMSLQTKLGEQSERIRSLENEVDVLKTENLKLTTDVKLIRNEHQELINTMFSLERKNQQISTENEMIKRKELSPYRSIQSRANQENITRSFSQNSHQSKIFMQQPEKQTAEDKEFISFQPSLVQINKFEDNQILREQPQFENHQRLKVTSGERNSMLKDNQPPHLLKAHTLNNASRMTSSRQQFNQSPDDINVKMHLPPVMITSDQCGTPTSYSIDNVQMVSMIKQRSLNALTTNLPTTAPLSQIGAPRQLSTNSSNTTPQNQYSATKVSVHRLQQQQALPQLPQSCSSQYFYTNQQTSHNGNNQTSLYEQTQPQLSDWVLERLNKGINNNFQK